MSSSSEMKNTLENFLIPLEEIQSATNNFDEKNQIGDGEFGQVYKGQLSELWGNRTAAIKRRDPNSYQGRREFETELQMVSKFHHQNIISFIGYCNEGDEIIILYEYAINGSLDHHLQDTNKRRSLTWAQRLLICLGAARGLKCLLSGLREHNIVIHPDVMSANIILDNNLQAKICNFGLSHTSKSSYYLDPLYHDNGVLTTESPIYSFGVVLFEMLSGMLAYNKRSIGDDMPESLILLVRRNWRGGLEKIIDPLISDQIDSRSLNTFKEIAYKCISYNLEERPTMDSIVQKIEKALASQDPIIMLKIPLEEIILATENFKTPIGSGRFHVVYKGKLSERWENRIAAIKCPGPNCLLRKEDFENELQMVSRFHHQNIIPFIGLCPQGNQMIMVYEYAINGCLEDHLRDTDRRSSLTWAQRLRICLGAARGLEYLHSGLQGDNIVIHQDVKSSKILLDDNMEAKICDFGLALGAPNTKFYRYPLHIRSSILTKEQDVYSFGVVMFELLSGLLANGTINNVGDRPLTLMDLVRQNIHVGLDNIIDRQISDQINTRCLSTFKEIAYRCISFILADRPQMYNVVLKLEEALEFQLVNFIIPLEEIISATKNFTTPIGSGGFGVVYKGKLSQRLENRTAAIKCPLPNSSQPKEDFEKELEMVSKFHHQNIIPFIGYCNEGDKRIMVYEYAVNGCLEDHLRDTDKRSSLTWVQRLRICIGIARGLEYLHSGLGVDHSVIHRDVKSANILLDDNMEAKICDFGLSRSAPKEQPQAEVHTRVAGTSFYRDPLYYESELLTKASDIYSFGVVMFEMLSGLLAHGTRRIEGDRPLPLLNLIRQYRNVGQDKVTDPHIRDEINSCSLVTFKRVAYKCISFDLKERPTMDSIIEKLQKALLFQENDDIGQQSDTDEDVDRQYDTDDDFDMQYDS